MKDVVAVHPHVARECVADGIVTHVAHVERARGIRQHFQHVIFRLAGMRLGGIERGILLPALEPLLLDLVRVISLVSAAVFPIRLFSSRRRLHDGAFLLRHGWN